MPRSDVTPEAPELIDHVSEVPGPLVDLIPHGLCGCLLTNSGYEVMTGVAVPLTIAGYLGRQGSLGPLADEPCLQLCDRCHLSE